MFVMIQIFWVIISLYTHSQVLYNILFPSCLSDIVRYFLMCVICLVFNNSCCFFQNHGRYKVMKEKMFWGLVIIIVICGEGGGEAPNLWTFFITFLHSSVTFSFKTLSSLTTSNRFLMCRSSTSPLSNILSHSMFNFPAARLNRLTFCILVCSRWTFHLLVLSFVLARFHSSLHNSSVGVVTSTSSS